MIHNTKGNRHRCTSGHLVTLAMLTTISLQTSYFPWSERRLGTDLLLRMSKVQHRVQNVWSPQWDDSLKRNIQNTVRNQFHITYVRGWKTRTSDKNHTIDMGSEPHHVTSRSFKPRWEVGIQSQKQHWHSLFLFIEGDENWPEHWKTKQFISRYKFEKKPILVCNILSA